MLGPDKSLSESAKPASQSPTPIRSLWRHPGVHLLAGIAVVSGAYGLGHRPRVGSLVERIVRSSQSSETTVLAPVFYGVAALAAFLIVLGLFRSFDLLVRRLRNPPPLKARPTKRVEEFIEEAEAAKISHRVASEGYFLLEAQYPHRMCIDLKDDLRTDLRLPDETIRAIDAMLRTRCDRCQIPIMPSDRAATGALELTPAPVPATVFDLLLIVENTPPLREDRSGVRERAADVESSNPSRQRRLSDSAQRKALHAATVAAIEAGSLHSPESPGLHRRFSDYTGPRRRATDDRIDVEYKGPFLRATDRTSDRLPERTLDRSPERHADRAAERPPISSPERKAQPGAVAAELNLRDPRFTTARSKRAAEPTH